MRESVRVSAIQMVSSLDKELNFTRAEKLIERAVVESSELVVLPEMFITYGQKVVPSVEKQFAFIERIGLLAKSHGVWIVAGTYPLGAHALGMSRKDPKPYAACLLFNPAGDCHARYLKIHLFDVDVNDKTRSYRESDYFRAGEDVCCFKTPWGMAGVAVCYDLRFPEVFIRLSQAGAKVIFVPSAFTEVTGEAHWEVLLRARAIESQCYIVAPNQGGKHENGRSTWGETMIVNPWGDVVRRLGRGEGLLTETLDFSLIDKIRQNMPIQNHRKLI